MFIDCRPFSETGGEVFHKISMKALCWTGGPKVLRTSVCREKARGPFLEVVTQKYISGLLKWLEEHFITRIPPLSFCSKACAIGVVVLKLIQNFKNRTCRKFLDAP